MKTHEDYKLVALISKPKGLRGEIVVRAPDDFPLSLYEGLDVWVVPPPLDGLRHTRVISLREQAKGLIATLEGVTDAHAAGKLVGRYLLARKTDLKDLAENAAETGVGLQASSETLSDCIGCLVYDEVEGLVGVICRVEDNPAHPLLVVETSFEASVEASFETSFEKSAEASVEASAEASVKTSAARKRQEILIPYVDEFIVRQSENRIDLRLPRGLIGLNV